MIRDTFIKKIFRLCTFLIITLSIFGCGGSTSGTGGVTVEGRIIELNNRPIEMAKITVVQSGESAVSDSQGNFSINTPFASTLELLIEENEFSVQSKIENIPDNIEAVVVEITVNRQARTTTTETKETRQREKDDDSTDDKSNGNGSSDKGEGSSSSAHSSDDKGGSDDSEESDDKGQSGSNSSSEGDKEDSSKDSSSDNESGDDLDDDSSDDNSNSSEGKEYQLEGLIAAISSSSVTVAGVTFVSTTNSEYRDADGRKTTLSAFTIGTRVKAKGKVRNSITELEKLEVEKD
jgi:hypothetical protein